MSGAATMDSPPELLNERKLMGMARDALHGVIDNNTIQQFQLLASKVLRDHGTLLAAVPQFQSSVELFERMDRRLKIVEEGLAKVPHGMKHVETFSRPVSVQRSVLGGNQADDIEDALVEHDKRLAELTGVIQGQAQRIGELEAALAEQGRQAAVLHEEVSRRVAEVDEAVQLIDVDIITEREANLIVLHEIATREASARAELGEWVRREFVPNGALAVEKSVREREWARAASDSAALRQEVEASRLQLIQRINDNATDIDNVKATIHSTENVLPTREEWDALGEALENANEWRDEAVDKITALRSDLTSMEAQHEALREQQGEVAALLEKQVASAAHEEQQRTVLVERLDAIHEDAEVIELVKNEIYEFAVREKLIPDPDAEDEDSLDGDEAEEGGDNVGDNSGDGSRAPQDGGVPLSARNYPRVVSMAEPDGVDDDEGDDGSSYPPSRHSRATSAKSMRSAKSSRSVRSVSGRRNMRANPLEIWEVKELASELVEAAEERLTGLLEAQGQAGDAAVAAARAEAAEGVRNAGRHVDGKITALADDIDALGKALRAVAEAAAKDASAREAKANATMESMLKGLQEQLEAAVGAALVANKQEVARMVAGQVAALETAVASLREELGTMGTDKADVKALEALRADMDKMWKETHRFLLDKVETEDLEAVNNSLGGSLRELTGKVENMAAIVYAAPRGGRGHKSDVEPADSDRQLGRSIKGLQDNVHKIAQSLTAAAADATGAKEALASSVPPLAAKVKGLAEEVQTLRAVLNSHTADALPKQEAKSLIERGLLGVRNMMPAVAREQVQLLLSGHLITPSESPVNITQEGVISAAPSPPPGQPTVTRALSSITETPEPEKEAKEGLEEEEGGEDGDKEGAGEMAAEVRAKVKGLRNELFSFRRDLSLQGTELQRLKDEFMERYFKHSEVELKLKMLGTKFDGLQERQLVILKDKATAAEVAALEAKLSELAGFVMPMQIASYDAMRASDPSPIPIADGMRSWLPASQAERMYDKASKSKAARQELMEQRSEGHLRDATLPPIESVTRHAKSARAAVPQAAREQRRAAFSARLEKLGVDNPVGRDE